MLTTEQIRMSFREMTETGGGFFQAIGFAGLHADETNRTRLYTTFEPEILQFYKRAERQKEMQYDND